MAIAGLWRAGVTTPPVPPVPPEPETIVHRTLATMTVLGGAGYGNWFDAAPDGYVIQSIKMIMYNWYDSELSANRFSYKNPNVTPDTVVNLTNDVFHSSMTDGTQITQAAINSRMSLEITLDNLNMAQIVIAPTASAKIPPYLVQISMVITYKKAS